MYDLKGRINQLFWYAHSLATSLIDNDKTNEMCRFEEGNLAYVPSEYLDF